MNTTEEIDFKDALSWLGLEFAKPPEGKTWLGVTTQTQSARLVISRVLRDSPAYKTGLQEGEEIIAIDGIRILPEKWDTTLEQYKPDDKAKLLVARRGVLRTVDITFATEPPKAWNLQVVAGQEERLKKWLRAED